MKIIRPYTVDESTNITSTNVTDNTLWSAGTYNLGDVVRHDVDGVAYKWQVVADPSTTETPSFASTHWANVGISNKMAPFDLQVGIDQFRAIETVATRADSIEYVINGLEVIQGIYIKGVEADNITITAVKDSVTVYSNSYDLPVATDINNSWWRWFFIRREFETEATFLNLNIPRDSTITITLTNTGETAQVNSIVLGTIDEIGLTLQGVSRSVKSRSIKRSEGLVTSLKRRVPSQIVSYPVLLTGSKGPYFTRVMEELDGKTAVWIADENVPEYTIFGFHTRATITGFSGNSSEILVEVEGL